MPSPTSATPLAALALGAGVLLPGAAHAADGGASFGSSSAPASSAATATSTSRGTTLAARRTALVRRRHAFAGRVPPRAAGRPVAVQRRSRSGWRTVARTTAARDGAFRTGYTPRAGGRFTYRAVPAGGSGAAAPRVGVTVFPRARATWYGPGFWGNTTACGQELTREMLGVAHKTLPCGTKVTLMYRGRTLTVPVIDRGPYAEGYDYDLTQATMERLGMPGTSTIGALPRR